MAMARQAAPTRAPLRLPAWEPGLRVPSRECPQGAQRVSGQGPLAVLQVGLPTRPRAAIMAVPSSWIQRIITISGQEQ